MKLDGAAERAELASSLAGFVSQEILSSGILFVQS